MELWFSTLPKLSWQAQDQQLYARYRTGLVASEFGHYVHDIVCNVYLHYLDHEDITLRGGDLIALVEPNHPDYPVRAMLVPRENLGAVQGRLVSEPIFDMGQGLVLACYGSWPSHPLVCK